MNKGSTWRVAAVAVMVLVVVYVGVDVVLQVFSPYSVVSDAESDLAVGALGWVMQVNFLLRAVMSGCLCFAIGATSVRSIRTVAGLVLLGAAGLCSGLLVFFRTDVNLPGEYGMTPRTVVGATHVVIATIGFVTVLAAIVLLTAASDRLILAFASVAVAGGALLLASLALVPEIVGLTERLCLVGILGWAFVRALAIRSTASTMPLLG